MSKRAEGAIDAIQSKIERVVGALDDTDYLEVLDTIEDYCKTASTCRRDELGIK